jgi:mannose/cellobiose epimerase-like protein (N-acyl-D-glucosamine 2-epimerase family)
MQPYRRTLIESPSLDAIRAVLPDYEVMLASVMDLILKRFERDPGYPYINTKLSIFTGEDFPEPQDAFADFKGRSAVFGWIQGRGLEALAGHVRWLPSASALTDAEKKDRAARLTRMTEKVFRQMEHVRAQNHGRMYFLLTPDGRPFTRGEDGRRKSFAPDPAAATGGPDMFYVKGMLAAAHLLNDRAKMEEAKGYFREVVANIEKAAARPDGLSFDPKNKPAARPGKRGHGGRMISSSGFALFASVFGDEEWYAGGERFVRYVLENHINRGQWKNLQPFDFCENIDAEGKPWIDDGRVLSDPGHSLEYVGLASKFLLVLREKKNRAPSQDKLLRECAEAFPDVLIRNFQNGWNAKAGGLCKAYDLVSRTPINGDMPWWNLPETMRAGAELLVLCPKSPRRDEILKIISDCSNAFVKNFVRPEVNLMAYQTVDASGKPVDVIPATPDLDPGYHTGLSIIDFMRCVRLAT